MANHMKNPIKNDHHDAWKARMCGRRRLQSLICLDLSCCTGSTSTKYASNRFLRVVCDEKGDPPSRARRQAKQR